MGSYPVMAGTPSRFVHVRLTEDESTMLRYKCAQLQMSKSDFIRMCIQLPITSVDSSPNARTESVIGIDRKTIQGILTETKRWGNNFNQGVRALNTIGRKYNASLGSSEHAKSVMENSARAMEFMNKAHEGIQDVLKEVLSLANRACVPVPED